MNSIINIENRARQLSEAQAHGLLDEPQEVLLTRAAKLRDHGHGRLISYSRKVFIPLTQLCRPTSTVRG